MSDVEILDRSPHSQQDMTELGAQLAGAGYTRLESRALIGLIQQASQQVALTVTPTLLEQIRRIQEARMTEVIGRIRTLPATMGYVHRDQIIRIITDMSLRPLQQQ